ncbi:MAG: mechanosensitive ion channel [Paludibacter sp.]|nr:mechanosensitive ion channel [Paludibacter sp.]
MKDIDHYINIVLFHIDKYNIKIYTLIIILLIIVISKLLMWLIKKALTRKRLNTKSFDEGSFYAVYQIIKYIIWIIAIALIMQTIGINLTVFLAGSAALLVGVGLGLQQTFNDIISGIILLSERSIKVNDILEIDDDVVRIQEIGMRTSVGLDRDDISIIIPNSKITTNKVVNWSHQSRKARFKINVGVAYGSNVDLVMKLMKDSALEHNDVSNKDNIEVRFTDFGNSSLNFQLLFYSENIFRIDRVKSEIRVIINRKFVENKVVIPFPQVDVHIKS